MFLFTRMDISFFFNFIYFNSIERFYEYKVAGKNI